jgi:drug/metabolite transporter (DMT)-like permease
MRGRLTLQILAVLVFSDMLETFTQFCFKKGALAGSATNIEALGAVPLFLKAVFSSPFLWLGLLSVFLTFIIWSTILSKIDLSVAVPVASFSYILVPLASIVFLSEKISWFRWLGIIFIVLGVIFVSLSTKEKEPVA